MIQGILLILGGLTLIGLAYRCPGDYGKTGSG
jgi:hypothetical protein